MSNAMYVQHVFISIQSDIGLVNFGIATSRYRSTQSVAAAHPSLIYTSRLASGSPPLLPKRTYPPIQQIGIPYHLVISWRLFVKLTQHLLSERTLPARTSVSRYPPNTRKRETDRTLSAATKDDSKSTTGRHRRIRIWGGDFHGITRLTSVVSRKDKADYGNNRSSPFVAKVARFDGERVVDPQRHVGDGEEGDQFFAGFLFPQVRGVRAAPQRIDDPRRLNEDLQQLREDDEPVEDGTVLEGRDHTEQGFGEERRDGDEKQHVIHAGDGMLVDVQFGGLVVCQYDGEGHDRQDYQLKDGIQKNSCVTVVAGKDEGE